MIWWIRHGPTHQKAFTGWRDVPADLSDTAALERLSDFLPDAPVLSSDLIRTRDTADAIARGRARLPDHAGLREIDFGAWDGLTFDVIADRWPELSRTYWEQPGDIAAPDGESWNDAAARVEAARQDIRSRHSGDLIIVAHFGTILTQVQRAAGCTAYEVLAQKIDNLSVTCIPDEGPATLINHVV
ncbi:MAG: histidine phosphatase family protein [Rhodobacteraceae bacterium]|nr:histidine phosphatase family protein [Paracoccaceae bacterium]